METITLNTGAKMPLEGFGVYQIPDAEQCEQAVYDAIKTYLNQGINKLRARRRTKDGIL